MSGKQYQRVWWRPCDSYIGKVPYWQGKARKYCISRCHQGSSTQKKKGTDLGGCQGQLALWKSADAWTLLHSTAAFHSTSGAGGSRGERLSHKTFHLSQKKDILVIILDAVPQSGAGLVPSSYPYLGKPSSGRRYSSEHLSILGSSRFELRKRSLKEGVSLFLGPVQASLTFLLLFLRSA